ncbi:MAG: hypothetical protein ACI9J0_004486, partial [Cryomorphaceae bacterium]
FILYCWFGAVFAVETGGRLIAPEGRLSFLYSELLRTLVQEWTDMNCAIIAANNFSGP